MLTLDDLGTPPAPRPSLVDDAYRALKEAIRENVFPPGYQGSEQEIASRLGMSRTPVHEAVIRLQEEGLVRVLTRRGVLICTVSPDDMREIYDVIIALEAMAAELLASLPEADRHAGATELARANEAMRQALERDDLTAWATADDLFHRTLIERSGNGRIARIARTIMDQSHRARMLTLRMRAKPVRSVEEHQAIIAAIAAGDPAQAGRHARDHRSRARDELIPLLARLKLRHL
jgi:DNA-binding GntR family transcriptional regulator